MKRNRWDTPDDVRTQRRQDRTARRVQAIEDGRAEPDTLRPPDWARLAEVIRAWRHEAARWPWESGKSWPTSADDPRHDRIQRFVSALALLAAGPVGARTPDLPAPLPGPAVQPLAPFVAYEVRQVVIELREALAGSWWYGSLLLSEFLTDEARTGVEDADRTLILCAGRPEGWPESEWDDDAGPGTELDDLEAELDEPDDEPDAD